MGMAKSTEKNGSESCASSPTIAKRGLIISLMRPLRLSLH
jgi:hypothetical protein